ncbi:hypothetical protein [Actinokineospora sp.]|uniref:hypothetical protein n=1 Tax=Actinokineospora sp. TaxID=1872133 RepID=UPI003D6C308B
MTIHLTTCWAIGPIGSGLDHRAGYPHCPSRFAADLLRRQAQDPDRWRVVALPFSCWTATCTGCECPLDPHTTTQPCHYRDWPLLAQAAAQCGWRVDVATARAWCPDCARRDTASDGRSAR